jgi:hypothetical protein
MKTLLNPDELEGLIMGDIRDHPACANAKVRVEPVTDPAADSNWRAEPYLASGDAPHRDCKIEVIASARKWGRDFDVQWPEDQFPNS